MGRDRLPEPSELARAGVMEVTESGRRLEDEGTVNVA